MNRVTSWHSDVTTARDAFHDWYVGAGQQAYRSARHQAESDMSQLLADTDCLTRITPDVIRRSPNLLGILRMCTAPRLARDRLVALAYIERSLIVSLESGRLPARMSAGELNAHLVRICFVLSGALDPDLFGWVARARDPSDAEVQRATFVVADRRCDAISDQIIRQAQRERQLQLVSTWLLGRGYRRCDPDRLEADPLDRQSFCVGQVAMVDHEIRVDALINPVEPAVLRRVAIRAVANADTTKMSKRAADTSELRVLDRDPGGARPLLLLGGPVEIVYLKDRAAEGVDWVWEHRLDDLEIAGI
ncbi:MAG TPA: XamI family restriction endonuclease [Propionibacteriaceae bacterium]